MLYDNPYSIKYTTTRDGTSNITISYYAILFHMDFALCVLDNFGTSSVCFSLLSAVDMLI